jgi:hypothetical protein
MQLKGLLVASLSALFVAVCAVSAPTPVFADTIVWANWTTATSGNPGLRLRHSPLAVSPSPTPARPAASPPHPVGRLLAALPEARSATLPPALPPSLSKVDPLPAYRLSWRASPSPPGRSRLRHLERWLGQYSRRLRLPFQIAGELYSESRRPFARVWWHLDHCQQRDRQRPRGQRCHPVRRHLLLHNFQHA